MSENLNEGMVLEPTAEKKLEPVKTLKGLRIAVSILIALASVFWIWMLIEAATAEGEGAGLGAAVMLVLFIVYGAVSYAVLLITSVVGLIISASKKQEYKKGTVRFFIVFTVLPVVLYVILFAAYFVVIGLMGN